MDFKFDSAFQFYCVHGLFIDFYMYIIMSDLTAHWSLCYNC